MFHKEKAGAVNYLNCVPSRRIEHEEDEDGRIILLRPKFMKGILSKYLQPKIKAKFFRVRLDDVGSATWAAIDGTRTVGEIADSLYEQFGEAVEPRYERCSKFVYSLYQGAMITIDQKEK